MQVHIPNNAYYSVFKVLVECRSRISLTYLEWDASVSLIPYTELISL
jgi:hypothetical protein